MGCNRLGCEGSRSEHPARKGDRRRWEGRQAERCDAREDGSVWIRWIRIEARV